MYGIGWSDDKKCRGCDNEEGTKQHRLYHCWSRREVRNQIPERLEKWETPRGMVCSLKQIPLHQVRKKQYCAEDAREVWELSVVGEGLQSQTEKMEKSASGRT